MNEKPSIGPTRPKARDGTQDEPCPIVANFYGQSTEPVPEFINDVAPPNRIESAESFPTDLVEERKYSFRFSNRRGGRRPLKYDPT